MPQDIRKSTSTLATDPSPLELPPNALDEALGVYIRRDGVAEPFVGGSLVSNYGTNTPVQLARYGSSVLAFYRNGSTPTCEVVGGSAVAPFELMPRDGVRNYSTAELRGNFYISQAGGPQKLAGVASGYYPAGMPAALQPIWSLQTYGSSFANWLAVNGVVAYRVCFRTKDANGVVVRGAPSFRVLARNNAAGARGTQLQIPLPLGASARVPVVPGDVIEVYRSFATASLTTEPDDELYLALEYTLTASDVSARVATIDDGVAERLLGAKLYTSPSQEGALQENRPPPWCADIEPFNRMMFYGDVRQPQFIEIKCRGTTNPIRAPFAFASDATSGMKYRVSSGTATAGSPNITLGVNLAAAGADLVGCMITHGVPPEFPGPNIPANTYITSYNPATGAAVMSQNATGSGATTVRIYGVVQVNGMQYYASDNTNVANREFDAGTTSTPPMVTLESLCWVINRTSTAGVVARYAADIGAYDVTQIPNASLIFERNNFSATTFNVRATNGAVFYPALGNPFNGPNTASSTDEWPGAAFVSKVDQPEHVPPVNFIAIGDPKRRIIRQVSTANALWVFKEDGLFRVTGFAPDALSVELIDPSLLLVKSLSADVLDGRVYALTTRGPVVITDGGVAQLSDAIDGDTDNSAPLRDQPQALVSATGEPCFVTCDASRRLVVFGINQVPGRLRSAGRSYILSQKTGSWTSRSSIDTVQHAVAEPSRGTLTWLERNPLAGANQTRVLRERSAADSYTSTQSYVAATLVSPSYAGTTVTVGAGSNLERFFASGADTGFFVQNTVGLLFRCISWTSPTQFTVDRPVTGTLSTAAFGARDFGLVGWRFMDAGAPAVGKVWREVAVTWAYTYLLDRYDVLFDNELGATATQTWTASATADWVDRTAATRRRMQTHRIVVPAAVARSALLRVRVRIRSAIAEYGLLGCSATFEPTSERVTR